MRAKTLGEDLRATAAAQPKGVAIIAGDSELTWIELERASAGCAAALSGMGIGRGDRVAVVLPNGLDMAIAVYGVLRAGAAFSPLNPATTPAHLERIFADLDPRAVICNAETAELVSAGPEIAVLSDVNALAVVEPVAERTMIAPDLAAVIYTSGSTGEPKGVTLTQGNMAFVADSIIEYLAMTGEDRILCVLPLSFGYGLYQLLTCVRTGAVLILEPGLGAPGRIVELLEHQRVTGFPAVPTMLQVLLSLRGLAERPLESLRFITNAGAGLPEPVVRSLRATMPNASVFLMYGQTECQRVCYLPPDQVDRRPTSVGIAIPGTETWIEDGEGNRVGAETVGELVVRGPHVMQGYWGQEEATRARLRPGRWPWERELMTGDLFRADDEDYLYFVSRRDDIIKSRGEKVAPREVEEIIFGFDGVQEAAVIGVADRFLGEAVHAHVAPKPGHTLEAAALLAHCATLLEPHKVPKRVVFHDRLPRIGAGKVDRRALKAHDDRG